MGYYIETTKSSLQKAEQLLAEFPSITRLSKAELVNDAENVTVCVVENGFFDAAAVCYSEREFRAFNDASDPRPKTWLKVPKTVLQSLIGAGRCPNGVLSMIA